MATLAIMPMTTRRGKLTGGSPAEDSEVEDVARANCVSPRVPASLVAPARKLLAETSVGAFLLERSQSLHPPAASGVAMVSVEDSVGHAMDVLATQGVQSVPVVDQRNLELVGFCGAGDVLSAFLHGPITHRLPMVLPEHMPAWRKGLYRGLLYTDTWERMSENKVLGRMSDLAFAGARFADRNVGSLRLGADGEYFFGGFEADASLLGLLSSGLFNYCFDTCEGEPDVEGRVVNHRAAVFTYDSKVDAMRVRDIISQVDIARFLLDHVNALGDLGAAALEKLGLVAGRMALAVEAHTPALEAFALMQTNGTRCVAVVSDHEHNLASPAPVRLQEGPEGKPVIANLSLSDFRGLQPRHFWTLALPVHEFLSLQLGVDFSAHLPELRQGVESDAERLASEGRARMPWPEHWAAPSERGGVAQAPATPASVLTCFPDETYAGALGLICSAGVHHLFVVPRDGPRVPLAVVSLTDLLRPLAVDNAALLPDKDGPFAHTFPPIDLGFATTAS